MKIYSICKKISASNEDHLDCLEKRKIELEAEDFKEIIAEKLAVGKNDDLRNEINGVRLLIKRKKKIIAI